MKYIIYSTTNLKSAINGINRIYIGVHKTNNPEIFDGYLGCNVVVNQASTFMYPKSPFQIDVKKYGVKSCQRNIMYVFDTLKEAVAKLKLILNTDFKNQLHVYNTGQDLQVLDKPLYQFNLKGKMVKKWDEALDAYEFYGLEETPFLSCVMNKIAYLGFYWSQSDKIDVSKYKGVKRSVTYIYSLQGKLLRICSEIQECADILNVTKATILEAIKNSSKVCDKYYVTNKLYSHFVPKPRQVYIRKMYYVYDKDGNLIKQCKGKEVMKVIDLHSWRKIQNIFDYNNNWYKDFYVSLTPVDHVPEKQKKSAVIEVYDKLGNFIEASENLRYIKDTYNIRACQLKNIQLGNKFIGDYIFKYNSK